MSWRRSPLFLGAGLLSACLLLVFVSVLVLREKAPHLPEPVVEVTANAKKEVVFAPDFGRLDELVPFAGGIVPVPLEVTPMEHGAEFRDSAWVKAQDPDRFTLQVMAAHDEEVIKRFLAEREDRAQFVYFINPQEGVNWYVVTVGSFATREQAAGEADTKDFGLSTRPFPRQMSAYQEAIDAAAP